MEDSDAVGNSAGADAPTTMTKPMHTLDSAGRSELHQSTRAIFIRGHGTLYPEVHWSGVESNSHLGFE